MLSVLHKVEYACLVNLHGEFWWIHRIALVLAEREDVGRRGRHIGLVSRQAQKVPGRPNAFPERDKAFLREPWGGAAGSSADQAV